MNQFKLILLVMITCPSWGQSTPREIAYKLHNRLAGVPPKPSVLADLEADVRAGRAEDAARKVIQHPNFINITIKNWVKSWSNREQSNRVDLNDHTATLMGIIRDDIGFDEALYGNHYYTVVGSNTAYANDSNNHYRSAETQRLDFSNDDILVHEQQEGRLAIPTAAVSGVITTRTSGESFFSAGTNRRVNRYTFMNFLCNDYEDLHDVTTPGYHVGRDVERTPGGDSRTYLNKCLGCHAGQDGLRGAYAYYDYTGNRLNYTGSVVAKINRNNMYSAGKRTVDDSWENLWSLPGSQNQTKLVFKGQTTGNGATSMNRMLAHSEGFANCMAKKVFELVCMKEPTNTDDKSFVQSQARAFEANGYKMKDLVVKTSVGCIANEK